MSGIARLPEHYRAAHPDLWPAYGDRVREMVAPLQALAFRHHQEGSALLEADCGNIKVHATAPELEADPCIVIHRLLPGQNKIKFHLGNRSGQCFGPHEGIGLFENVILDVDRPVGAHGQARSNRFRGTLRPDTKHDNFTADFFLDPECLLHGIFIIGVDHETDIRCLDPFPVCHEFDACRRAGHLFDANNNVHRPSLHMNDRPANAQVQIPLSARQKDARSPGISNFLSSTGLWQ